MISILSIIINLCFIVAIYRLEKDRMFLLYAVHSLSEASKDALSMCLRLQKLRRIEKRLGGRIEKSERRAAISEKMAERAFNLASSANLGVVALQKSLAVPRILTKTQATQNVLAKKEIDRLFTREGGMEWLKPILSDEELEILEKAEAHQAKYGTPSGEGN